MTSPEVTPRRPIGVYGESAAAAARHANVFTWSRGHVTVRDLVSKHLVQMPTIVKVSTGCRSDTQPTKFNFHEGTLYLVRSVWFQQLVVARTPDDHYVTIPRDCPLAFHLVSKDNSLTNTALTLSTILGSGSESGDDEGPCNGQRVQLSTTDIVQYSALIPLEVCERLQLEDVYKETFLLCHALVGGTVSSRLTVIPGYLPLKLSITRRMTPAAGDFGSYVSDLYQAVCNYGIEYNFNDPQEIAVFSEPPNNHYEWIEPRPISKSKSNLAPALKSSTLAHPTASSASPQLTSSSDRSRTDGGQFSLDSQVSKRPLPPIPRESADDAQWERSDSGRFEKYLNNTRSGAATMRWHSRVIGTKSDTLARTGSEPNLLQDDKRGQKLSTSQSLEFLNADDSPKEKNREKSAAAKQTAGRIVAASEKTSEKTTFLSLPRRVRPFPASAVATGNREPRHPSDNFAVTSRDDDGKTPAVAAAGVPPRPPPPPKPSAEEIVYNFRAKAKRNSLLRRQRPVSPRMRRRSGNFQQPSDQADPLPSATTLQYPHSHDDDNPYILASTTTSAEPDKRLDIRKPANLDLQRAPMLPSELYNDDEENIYDRIASPMYKDMSRSSAGSKSSRQSSADTTTGSTGVCDDSVYVSASDSQKYSLSMSRAGRPLTTEKSARNETGLFQDVEDGYCMPESLMLDDAERGQGVGAEEDSNHYKGPPGKRKTAASAVSPCGKIVSPTSATSDGVGYASLDDVPADLGSLSLQEVCQCLRLLNLHQHEDSFSRAQIDGQLLVAVDQQMLVEELGFKRFDAVKLEKFARHGWRPKMVRASPSQHQLQHHYYSQQPQSQQQETVLYLHLESLYTDVSSPDNCTVV